MGSSCSLSVLSNAIVFHAWQLLLVEKFEMPQAEMCLIVAFALSAGSRVELVDLPITYAHKHVCEEHQTLVPNARVCINLTTHVLYLTSEGLYCLNTSPFLLLDSTIATDAKLQTSLVTPRSELRSYHPPHRCCETYHS